MKIEYLQKIIARIQSQIHCPKCKAPFVADQIEILGVKGTLVEFSAGCHQCQSRSQISAEITNQSTKTSARPISAVKRPLSGLEIPNVNIAADMLAPLKSSLQNFKSHDVSDLFN